MGCTELYRAWGGYFSSSDWLDSPKSAVPLSDDFYGAAGIPSGSSSPGPQTWLHRQNRQPFSALVLSSRLPPSSYFSVSSPFMYYPFHFHVFLRFSGIHFSRAPT